MTGKLWKKLLIIWLSGCIVGPMSLCACAQLEEEIVDEEGILKYLESLSSYEAEVAITFYSNKNATEFLVKQQVAKDTAGLICYRMEILEPASFEGVTTVSDGTTVTQTDPSIRGTIQARQTPVRDALLLSIFVQQYEASRKDFRLEEGMAVLQAEYPGEPEQLSVGELIFRTDSRQPETLRILDAEGNLAIQISFRSFEANPSLAEDFYRLEESPAVDE